MEHRTLGTAGPQVSALSLGSWRTFEELTRKDGAAVMRAAREAGIDFLDDARYDDHTGSAPIPSGYSEVVFGELFRIAGWARDETTVANKLWWEYWPQQGAVEEIQLSLGRMGFEHVDLIYAERPPENAPLEEILEGVAEVLEAGLARYWGILNWSAELTARVPAAVRRLRPLAPGGDAAAVQPGPPLDSRGPRDAGRAHRGRDVGSRLVGAARRRAQRQVQRRSRRGRAAGRADRRPGGARGDHGRGDAERILRRARSDLGRRRDRLRAARAQRRQRAVRRDHPRPDRGEPRRARGAGCLQRSGLGPR